MLRKLRPTNMRHTLAALTLTLFTGIGAGCGGDTMRVVAQRATHDLSCPKASLAIRNIGGTSYAAEGCGRKATYICSGSNFMSDGTCMRER